MLVLNVTLLGLQDSSLDCLPIVHVTITNTDGLVAVIVCSCKLETPYHDSDLILTPIILSQSG